MRFVLLLLCSLGVANQSQSAPSASVEALAAIQDLVPASQLPSLAKTYPVDRPIRWRLHIPNPSQASGVLVFVSATANGEPPRDWIRVLDERNIIWIAACDFGNRKASAQRVLIALMGLAYAQRQYKIDPQRVYIAGMSGGGRVASKIITKFPRLFNGAIYIVGADSWEDSEASLLPQIVRNRYVFITGTDDFNRRELRAQFLKYQSAGASQSYLMDLPHYGHQLPNADQLRDALVYLDGK